MTMKMKFLLVALCAVSVLAACGKKVDGASQSTSNSTPTAAADNTPHYKQTEKFGTVNSILLTPLFQAPSKYSTYIRQEVSETNKEEYRNLPLSSFEGFKNTWIKQAASVEKPNWQMIAGITHPEISVVTNEFKKQEIIDKTKTEVVADKSQLNVIYGWQGEILLINGPDVTNGEYYLVIRPDSPSLTVSYNNEKNYAHMLSYRPVFDEVGMTGDNRGDMEITVKVPVEKAKEIESLREGGLPMIRVYGHVLGVDSTRVPITDLTGNEASLGVEVEALEFGIRKNGAFKTFFFLDSDQLKRSKT